MFIPNSFGVNLWISAVFNCLRHINQGVTLGNRQSKRAQNRGLELVADSQCKVPTVKGTKMKAERFLPDDYRPS